MNKQFFAGVHRYVPNVERVHLNAKGEAIPIWEDNRLALKLLKKGWLSPLWINSKLAKFIAPFLGSWKMSASSANILTNAGIAALAGLSCGVGSVPVCKEIGIGTGVTAVNTADTTLEDEIKADGTAAAGVHVLPAAQVTNTLIETTVPNDTANITGLVTASAPLAITKYGLFNADTNGTLIAEVLQTVLNLPSGDSVALTWKLKAEQGA
jgi:hypothetical protein